MKEDIIQPKTKHTHIMLRSFSAANPDKKESFSKDQPATLCPALAAVCVRKGWARPIESK